MTFSSTSSGVQSREREVGGVGDARCSSDAGTSRKAAV